jgi:hypothetical protein
MGELEPSRMFDERDVCRRAGEKSRTDQGDDGDFDHWHSSALTGRREPHSQRLPKHVGSTPWLRRTRYTSAGAADLLL